MSRLTFDLVRLQDLTPDMYQTFLLAGAVTLIVLWLSLKFLAKRKVQTLHTKYVFITGCDSGFGRETAIRLDKMGVHVMAACLTKQGAQDLKSMTSGKLKTFQMDVTDSQQIKDVFEQVKKLLPLGQGKEKSGGGGCHMKTWWMLVVSLRGVNQGFWSHLGCLGRNATIFSRQSIFYGIRVHSKK